MNPATAEALAHLVAKFCGSVTWAACLQMGTPHTAQRYPVRVRIEAVESTFRKGDGELTLMDHDGFREDKFEYSGCDPFTARTRAGYGRGRFNPDGTLTVSIYSAARQRYSLCSLTLTKVGPLLAHP